MPVRFLPLLMLVAALSTAAARAAAPLAGRPLVAIIDSGIARTAELAPVLVGELDMAGARPAHQPRFDHGTMVATILHRAAGGAIDIVSFRIDDPAGCPAGQAPPCQPDAAPIIAAIEQATDRRVHAINMSLSLADDPGIAEAVRRAAARGILVVMAAGNAGRDRPDNAAMARAGFPHTVLVGATDSAGRPWPGSNRPVADDRLVYVWRPGVAVATVSAAGVPVTGTGTSFAAPIETARRVLARPLVLAARAPGADPVRR